MKFYPLNSEWDYDDVIGGIYEKIRKKIGSKRGRMIFPSPKSKNGVAEFIESTEGMVSTELKVIYAKSDDDQRSRKGTIRDDQISDVMQAEIEKDLEDAYDEVYTIGRNIKAVNFQNDNQKADYIQFLNAQKSDGEK